MLEIKTLDILRRKIFIYYEKLGAPKILGRVGRFILSWASKNDSHQESSGELLPVTCLDCGSSQLDPEIIEAKST